MDETTRARVDEALEQAFPSSPLNVMARRINRLAEVLPHGHECEPIFGEFDALGEYVFSLEEQRDTAVRKARKLADGVGLDWVDDDVLSTEWALSV